MRARKRSPLRELVENVKRYSPIVKKKLGKAGIKPDAAVVFSVAKYYPALKRLAKE